MNLKWSSLCLWLGDTLCVCTRQKAQSLSVRGCPMSSSQRRRISPSRPIRSAKHALYSLVTKWDLVSSVMRRVSGGKSANGAGKEEKVARSVPCSRATLRESTPVSPGSCVNSDNLRARSSGNRDPKVSNPSFERVARTPLSVVSGKKGLWASRRAGE